VGTDKALEELSTDYPQYGTASNYSAIIKYTILSAENPAFTFLVATHAAELIANAINADPPAFDYQTSTVPQAIEFPPSGNATKDKILADYGQYLGYLIASLQAGERSMGAAIDKDANNTAIQGALSDKYWNMAANMQNLISDDNATLASLIPYKNLNTFPDGLNGLAAVFAAQCGNPLDPKVNQAMLARGLTQTQIDRGVCDVYQNVQAADLPTDLSAAKTPLPPLTPR
jgi:hypothetical protein